MATLVYTQAPTVAAGESMSAADMAGWAAAINSRVLGGAGDCDWRIGHYLFAGLFRQIRNHDELGNFPPEAEYFSVYQALEARDVQWPLTGPGDPEGVNTASQIGAFVHGVDALDLASERGRLETVPTVIVGDVTPTKLWALGKEQRGAYDAATGAYASPMFDLALGYLDIRTSPYSPHGNSFGGFAPGPLDAGGCAAIRDLIPPNLQVFFTRLADNYVLAFDGTCPEQPTHIAALIYRPLVYIVILNDGATYHLPKAQWIEGPYTTDAQLRRQSANALSRMVTQFAAEFRGTAAQRAEADQGIEAAFQLEDDFLARQYPLAPAIGQDLGFGVLAKYPRWTATGTAALQWSVGEALPGDDGEAFGCPEGSVLARLHVSGSGLVRDVVLALWEGGEEIERFSVSVTEGAADAIVTVTVPRRFAEARVKLAEPLDFTASAGQLAVEALVQLAYQPGKDDYYAVTRLASYTGSFDALDGRGLDCDQAREIGTALLANGCLLPLGSASASAPVGAVPAINQNAVYDAARRLSKCVRILPRAQLVKYAVAEGKSVLWFRRFAYGLSHDTPADLFDGLGPARDAVENGAVEWGVTYEVESGVALYPPGGSRYAAGQTFVGEPGQGGWSGEAVVRERDGIRRTAPPQGWSRRWCLNLTLKPYHPSESSVWKASAFADVITPYWQRCGFDSPGITFSAPARRHYTFGGKPAYIPEMPSGHNYAPTPDNTGHYDRVNEPQCTEGDTDCEDLRARFYRSCRIYEPPVEIESAVRVTAGGEELVKVTLTGRLHHHHALAPASIDEDYTTWVTAEVRAEAQSYRTLENGLREYLLNQFVGYHADATGPGNCAWASGIRSDPEAPFGSCYPTFLFTALIPEPHLDGNDDEDDSDSPKLSDPLRLGELYLRAMCEGFVDGRTTAALACSSSTTTLFDYTFPNLLFDALGNRWVPLLPEAQRPDNPEGHGPMPLTAPYADLFNALARAVNRLVTVRVMLPSALQFRDVIDTYTVDVTDSVKNSDGDLAVDTAWTRSGAAYAVWLQTGVRSGSLSTVTGTWSDSDSGVASTLVTLAADGSAATLTTTRTRIEWRWNHKAGSELALPPTISGLLTERPAVVLRAQETTYSLRRTVAAGSSSGTQCVGVVEGPTSSTWADSFSGASLFTQTAVTGAFECSYDLTGSRIAKDPPSGDVWTSDSWPDDVPTNSCSGGVSRVLTIEAVDSATAAITIPTAAYVGGS